MESGARKCRQTGTIAHSLGFRLPQAISFQFAPESPQLALRRMLLATPGCSREQRPIDLSVDPDSPTNSLGRSRRRINTEDVPPVQLQRKKYVRAVGPKL